MNTLMLSFSAMLLYIATAMARFYGKLDNNTYLFIPQKTMLMGLGIVAVILHALVLYQSVVTPEGLNLGVFNAASMVTWVIALLLLLTLSREPVENLIFILFPLAALSIALDTYFPSVRILAVELGVKFHIFSAIVAYSFLSISALQAIFIAIQDYQLRHKHPGWVIQILPPLQIMETLLFQLIALGIFWLSLGLISGFLFVEDLFAQHLVHKTVLSLIAWGFFVILLWGHWQYGWRGRKAIYWTLSGFVLLMLAYFGSKIVLELVLQRY
ncbi:cytochrome C assembly family protein [Beggiatoa leptomitoformis]|uniref:Phosphohydrolase n=1 Tax=Beggiatoa leptomitoformis TaxID=288004 RepID=A0A2N9YHQ0_9GAMM|nr:cytochrome c biogenesis protein CcsA [Beggiatoa leptomitoformis]ALG67974.1 phosphohydrolase [Beggiatoa leptomitoformis]AUI69746.1 phosphohydrolase [Beggiatoa leptomitoformis]